MTGIERFYSPPEIGAPGRREGNKWRRDLFYTGLFTIAMLVALVLAIGFLFRLSGETLVYTTECASSGGIGAGAAILQKDYPIGKVVSVEPKIVDGKKGPPFTLSLQIDRDWRVLPSDRFLVGSAGLLKGNVVNLLNTSSPENATKQNALDAGAKLVCEVEPSLMEKLDPILTSIKKQVTAIESFLISRDSDSGDNQQNIAGVLENLRSISEQLKQQMAAIHPEQLSEIVHAARNTAENVERISAALNRNSSNIDHTVADFGEVAERLKQTIVEADPKFQRSLTETQFLLREFTHQMRPILNNLEESTENLKQLSQDLRNNPGSVIWDRPLPDNSPDKKP